MTSPLRRLDDTWVPRLARRLRRITVPSRSRSGPARQTAEVVAAARAEPALAGSIAAVLIAAVLIAVAGGRPDAQQPTEPSLVIPTPPSVPVATIGPAPGTSVAVYTTRAAFDLRHYGDIAAGRPTYAVIDLRHYETPGQARRTLQGADVVRAYVRVPSRRPTEPRSVPLTGIGDLVTGMRTAATVAAATVKSYGALIAALHPHKAADRLVKRRYVAQYRAAGLEAHRLGHPATCRCVFAFVVLGDVTRLGALARLGDVRIVDPAPPAIPLTGLTVLPLQPQVTTVVPRTGLIGG